MCFGQMYNRAFLREAMLCLSTYVSCDFLFSLNKGEP